MKTDKQDKRGIGAILAFVVFLLLAIASGSTVVIIIFALLLIAVLSTIGSYWYYKYDPVAATS